MQQDHDIKANISEAVEHFILHTLSPNSHALFLQGSNQKQYTRLDVCLITRPNPNFLTIKSIWPAFLSLSVYQKAPSMSKIVLCIKLFLIVLIC